MRHRIVASVFIAFTFVVLLTIVLQQDAANPDAPAASSTQRAPSNTTENPMKGADTTSIRDLYGAEPAPPEKALTFVVEDQRGEPITGASIEFGEQSFVSDVRGVVTIPNFTRGEEESHEASVRADGCKPTTFSIQASTKRQVIRLWRESRLSGCVLGFQQKDEIRATIVSPDVLNNVSLHSLADDGWFQLRLFRDPISERSQSQEVKHDAQCVAIELELFRAGAVITSVSCEFHLGDWKTVDIHDIPESVLLLTVSGLPPYHARGFSFFCLDQYRTTNRLGATFFVVDDTRKALLRPLGSLGELVDSQKIAVEAGKLNRFTLDLSAFTTVEARVSIDGKRITNVGIEQGDDSWHVSIHGSSDAARFLVRRFRGATLHFSRDPRSELRSLLAFSEWFSAEELRKPITQDYATVKVELEFEGDVDPSSIHHRSVMAYTCKRKTSVGLAARKRGNSSSSFSLHPNRTIMVTSKLGSFPAIVPTRYQVTDEPLQTLTLKVAAPATLTLELPPNYQRWELVVQLRRIGDDEVTFVKHLSPGSKLWDESLDDEMQVRLSGVPPDNYQLTVVGTGRLCSLRKRIDRLSLESGATRTVAIQRYRLALVRVWVSNPNSISTPRIYSAEVPEFDLSQPTLMVVRDPEKGFGYFFYNDAPPGQYIVSWQDRRTRARHRKSIEILVAEDLETNLEID